MYTLILCHCNVHTCHYVAYVVSSTDNIAHVHTNAVYIMVTWTFCVTALDLTMLNCMPVWWIYGNKTVKHLAADRYYHNYEIVHVSGDYITDKNPKHIRTLSSTVACLGTPQPHRTCEGLQTSF